MDINFHAIASQLSGHCDLITNRFWRLQQNVKRTSEAWRWCVKIVVFIVIYEFVLSCKKWNNVFDLVTKYLCTHFYALLFWCVCPSLLRKSGNKHQNNPVVSTLTVRHSSKYIIRYVFCRSVTLLHVMGIPPLFMAVIRRAAFMVVAMAETRCGKAWLIHARPGCLITVSRLISKEVYYISADSGLAPNERRLYNVTPSLIGWEQT